MTTSFAVYNQTADFKRCTIQHYATAKGYVECGGRINGDRCEFDHDQVLEFGIESEDPGPEEVRGFAFCDNYGVHGHHFYTAINSETYECRGITQVDVDYLDKLWNDTCEHGLSAFLCNGEGHY